ncbi:hypothetical protein AN639_00560 [Candidatus Epulonipiscium fishelsonii]|uniref:Uncharacterized protein n=1 Tax=Candidatus Epulonipiscium fishelsonii TaxID=77094 RepID=A0ACC8XBU2_9FIRM|nr:hypothetical protein AN396_07220 [Epulopiscium sp. SCG-B11WGA-EpuloA1]ONI41292.1 hypothetical protein AN639_00560 [Epulopiscium sp. SCG-B05WGA-EpuloA1]ONI47859.1 hypothetical protein AN644_03590 [Epulopiscium sp. SCG-C06WGA-EpuloA1]
MSGKLSKALHKLTHDTALYELKRLYSYDKKSVLSYHDTLYLNIIEAHPNKYTSSQIADLLKITRPSVTEKINQLCKKGYILRTQSETDKRVFYLSINPDSPKDYETTARYEEEMEREVLAKFGEEKVDIFCEMIEFLSDLMFEDFREENENE